MCTHPGKMKRLLDKLFVAQQLRSDLHTAMKKAKQSDISFSIDKIAMDNITLGEQATISNPFKLARLIRIRVTVQTEIWKVVVEDREYYRAYYPRACALSDGVWNGFQAPVAGLRPSDGSQGKENKTLRRVCFTVAKAEIEGKRGLTTWIGWRRRVPRLGRAKGRSRMRVEMEERRGEVDICCHFFE